MARPKNYKKQEEYLTSRVEGKGFGGKVLSDIMDMGINITPD